MPYNLVQQNVIGIVPPLNDIRSDNYVTTIAIIYTSFSIYLSISLVRLILKSSNLVRFQDGNLIEFANFILFSLNNYVWGITLAVAVFGALKRDKDILIFLIAILWLLS